MLSRPPVRSLDRLLRPRSIAVFGGRQAEAVITQCDKFGFDGAIWPVHPNRDEIGGRRCYRLVEDLPDAPDAAFIGVNRDLTIEIVRHLAHRGAGGATCYASGFRESIGEIAGGDALQTELVTAAGSMPIIGPNCYGLINALDGALMWPDQHGLQRETSGVVLISQSSNVAINLSMQARGLPIAYLMTPGNQAQTGLSAMAAGVLEDPRVTALGFYIEGIDDVRAFEEMALRARALKKPIVVFKAGRSEQAQAATLSHTASIAGSDAAADAFFRRLGIARVRSIPVMLETLKLLHVHGPLPGGSLGSVSCSGGEAAIMADTVHGRQVRFPPLADNDARRIKATLSDMVAVANPLDYHTFIWGDRERMTATFSAFLETGFDLTGFIIDFPRSDRCDDSEWNIAIDAIADAATKSGKPTAVVSSLGENISESWAQDLMARDLVPLMGIEEAVSAIEAAVTIGMALQQPEADRLLVWPRPDGEDTVDDEATAKTRLAAHGLQTPGGRIVQDVEAAVDAAKALGGPVVVKALGLAHKSEHNAVRVGLETADDVQRAAQELLTLSDRLLVEEMVGDGIAELIVGVTHDPQYGLMLTLGAGGVLVELLRDTATLLLPASDRDIREALESLYTAPLLHGYRGKPAGDVDAVVEAARAIAHFAEANAETLIELDVNPLIVRPRGKGAVAVDALIRERKL